MWEAYDLENEDFLWSGIPFMGGIGMDFSRPGEYQKFLESGIWKDKCEKYVTFMIEKLYELEDDKGLFVQAP